MQRVIFANRKILDIYGVGDSYAHGRKTLVFTIPETESDFDELKTLMNNPEATETITIETEVETENEDEDGDGEPNVIENVQEGFIIPGPLTYENGRFIITLEKPTVQEKRIVELEEAVVEIASATKQNDRQNILDGLNIKVADNTVKKGLG